MTSTSAAKDNSGWVWVFWLIVGAIAWYLFDWNTFSSDKVTTYGIRCAAKLSGDECPGGWIRIAPVTYTVFSEQQLVVRQQQGGEAQRLSSCSVVDKKNWKCKTGPRVGDFFIGFTDGTYWSGYELVEGGQIMKYNTGSEVQNVAKWKWMLDAKDEVPSVK
jgi:hypothetical protein